MASYVLERDGRRRQQEEWHDAAPISTAMSRRVGGAQIILLELTTLPTESRRIRAQGHLSARDTGATNDWRGGDLVLAAVESPDALKALGRTFGSVACITELQGLRVESPLARVVFVDVAMAKRVTLPALVLAMGGENRLAGAILYDRLSRATATTALLAGACGFDAVVFRGIDDSPDELRTQVRRVGTLRAANRVLASAAVHCPGLPRPVWLALIDIILGGEHVRAQRRTARGFAADVRKQLPVALDLRTLTAWARVALAAAFLERTHHEVRHVARWLRYSSSSALCNASQHLLGLAPAHLRAEGSLRHVLQEMRAAMLPDIGAGTPVP
jgi:hypothetical protein